MRKGSLRLPWWKRLLFLFVAAGIGSVLTLLGGYALFLPLCGRSDVPSLAWVQALAAAVLLLLCGIALWRRGIPGFEEAIPWGCGLIPWVLGNWLHRLIG